MTQTSSLNLLPAETKAKLAQKHIQALIMKAGFLLLVLQLTAVGILMVWRDTANEARDLMDTRVATLRLNLKSFNELRDQAILITDRAGDYTTIEESILSWPAVLSDLSTATPTDLTLSSLQVSRDGAKLKASLSGDASSRGSIILFREQLEQTPNFDHVDFQSSQLTNSDTQTVTFTMAAEIVNEQKGTAQ